MSDENRDEYLLNLEVYIDMLIEKIEKTVRSKKHNQLVVLCEYSDIYKQRAKDVHDETIECKNYIKKLDDCISTQYNEIVSVADGAVTSYSKNLEKYLNFYSKKNSKKYIFDEVDTKMMFIQMSNSFKVLRDAIEDCYLDKIIAHCSDVDVYLLTKIEESGASSQKVQEFRSSIDTVADKCSRTNDHAIQIITKCHIKRELELARWENEIIGDLDNYSKRKDILSDKQLKTLFGDGFYDKTMKISTVLTEYLIPQIISECKAIINEREIMLKNEAELENNLNTYIKSLLDEKPKKAEEIVSCMLEHIYLVNQIASKSLKLKQSAYLQIRSEDVKYKTMVTVPYSKGIKNDTYWKYLLAGKTTTGAVDEDIKDCYVQFSHDVKKSQDDHICEHHAEGFYKYYVRTFIRQQNTNKLDPDFLYMYQTRASSDVV